MLEVWLERDDGCGERGGDAGLNGADRGLVVLFDGLFGVEVEPCTAAVGGGSGDTGGVDDIGQVLGCSVDVIAKVFLVEDDAKAAVADFTTAGGNFGIGGWFEG